MSVTSRVWNFGDGTTGSTNPILHNFKAAGSYAISLTNVIGKSSVIPPPGPPGVDIRSEPSGPLFSHQAKKVWDASDAV